MITCWRDTTPEQRRQVFVVLFAELDREKCSGRTEQAAAYLAAIEILTAEVAGQLPVETGSPKK